MTGIERLREFAEGISPFTVVCGVTTTSYDRRHTEVEGARLRDFLSDIAGQIERERDEERSRWDDELCDAQMDKTCVMAVYLEMNRHVLGHEGMEDSPVARWARELRAALDVRDDEVTDVATVRKDTYDAYEWVCEHGGLDAVKRRWECLSYYADPVPRSRMEKRLARLQRQIDESHAALRRRREVISKLNRRACDLTRENAERGETIRKLSDRAAKQSDEIRVMRDVIAETCARLGVEGTGSTVDDAQVIWREIARRLMPDGMEWPRFESGEQVRPVDRLLDKGGDWFEATSFVFTCDWWSVRGYQTEGFGELSDKTRRKLDGMAYGTCVKRPAHKVLDADGAEIRVGDTVYDVDTGEKMWVCALPEQGAYQCVKLRLANGMFKTLDPYRLTHRGPILAADGKPLREGETVWDTNGDELVIGALEDGGHTVTCRYVDVGDAVPVHGMWSPSDLTHERPDSWERIEEDADRTASLFDAFDSDASADIRDLVRRARALAGRDAS